MTFYTDKFIPKGSAACARGFVIFIRPKYKDDIGLLEHEKTHVRQWLFTLSLHSPLYLFCKRYKLWAEVQAYRRQLLFKPAFNEDSYRIKYAGFIATKYKLTISQGEAYKLLGG